MRLGVSIGVAAEPVVKTSKYPDLSGPPLDTTPPVITSATASMNGNGTSQLAHVTVNEMCFMRFRYKTGPMSKGSVTGTYGAWSAYTPAALFSFIAPISDTANLFPNWWQYEVQVKDEADNVALATATANVAYPA